MLQSIRDRAQGWIAGIVLGFVTVPFAFWGVQSYIDFASEVVVARIDGEAVTRDEYRVHAAQFRRSLEAATGRTVDEAEWPALQKQALEQLVQTRVLEGEARAAGMRVGDLQVAAQIQSVEGFQQDGTFSEARYADLLRSSGMSPRAFEEKLRAEMLVDQLRLGVVESTFLVPLDADEAVRLADQRRTIAWAQLSAAAALTEAAVADADIEAYYAANGAEFMTEETVVVESVLLDRALLAAAVPAPDDEALQAWYDANLQRFETPEERAVRHILIPIAAGADDATVARAAKRADELLARLRDGADFAELAKTESGDPGTAAQGGDLGFIRRGVMVPEFEAAAFALAKGELGQPVRTPYGLHLLRVDEVRGGERKGFEEVRAEVEEAVRQERAEALFYEQVERLETQSFENADSLGPVASALGLEVTRSAPFGRKGGEGDFAAPPVVAAAFSDEVLGQRLNSAPIDLGGSRAMVLRVVDHQPARQRPLDEVREDVRRRVAERAAREATSARGRALLARLRAGEDAAALATAEGLSWQRAEAASREEPTVSRAVLRAAFALGRPAAGPLYTGVPLGSGDYMLVAVEAVEEGGATTADAEVEEARRARLLRRRGLGSWIDFVDDSRRRTDLETWPERI